MFSNIHELKKHLRCLEQKQSPGEDARRTRVPSGCQPLDSLLPGQGFARGSLVEWLAGSAGSGASGLALMAAREACCQGGALVLVDRHQVLYPPAVAAWRVDLQRTILVRPHNEKDEFWALDQALRCPHVAAVVGWPGRLDGLAFRRLQLAAETSHCLGLLVRDDAARREPSWADARLRVSTGWQNNSSKNSAQDAPAGWRLHVELLRCRGRFGKSEIDLEVNDQTGEIHEAHPSGLAAELAGAAVDLQKSRA